MHHWVQAELHRLAAVHIDQPSHSVPKGIARLQDAGDSGRGSSSTGQVGPRLELVELKNSGNEALGVGRQVINSDVHSVCLTDQNGTIVGAAGSGGTAAGTGD